MHILSVKDPAFRKYGRVITNVDFTQLVEEMKKTPVPDGVVYEPGINALEALPVKKELETITYGSHTEKCLYRSVTAMAIIPN